MNLPLILSDDSKIPLHTRLKTALMTAIDQGRIAPLSPLPSTRELSASMGISRPTVVRAYEELVRIGYLETRPGGKTCVANKNNGAASTSGQPDDQPSQHLLGGTGRRLAGIELRRGAAADQPILDFGAPPNWALPLHGWKQILKRNCANIDPAQFNLSPHPFGHESLRQATLDYLKRRQGVDCSLDQLIVFSGSQSPLFFIAQLFIEPGDNIVVENPGHIGARNMFTACGARILPAPVDDEGINIDAVKECARDKIKFIYITPKYHDPTGVCLSPARREQLIAVAREQDILIIEDAWDSDYCYISPDLPALQSTAQSHVFYIHSFWKTLYPLSTVACLVVPKQYTAIFETAKSLIDGINPALEHYTLAEFIADGHLERHLKTTTRQLTQQRQILIEDLVKTFGGAVTLPKQSAAFWLTAQLDRSVSPNKLLQAARATGVKMISTDAFYIAPPVRDYNEFLIAFTDPVRRVEFTPEI